jgi:hypothetical protein
MKLLSSDRLPPRNLKRTRVRIGGHYRTLVFTIAIVVSGVVPVAQGAAPSALLAGAASAPVSPLPGTYIAGDAKNRKFSGVHDDVFAKAVVLSDGEEALAIVTVDCIGLLAPDIGEIRRRASSRVGLKSLAPERIIISSTHTHSGPDVVGIWGPDDTTSGRDEAYMALLVETVARQILDASSKLEGVAMRYGETEAGHAWVENICEPELLDRKLTTVLFSNASGETVASLTNFACHPTYMDAQSDLVSSDYVAGFYQAMSSVHAGEHLFLQGAIGGWVQPNKDVRTFEAAARRGAELAAASLRSLDKGKTAARPKIEFANKRIDVPLENPGFQALAQLGILSLGADGFVHTEVAWCKIGPVQLATHPGESSPAHALKTRLLMSGEVEMVLGLGLDAIGYILTPPYYEEDSKMKYAAYLTRMSVGPKIGPMMMTALGEIIP